MCLIALVLDDHPRFPLVIAANRDEFYRRPAAPLAWWGSPDMLAGRDLEAGGTWLGLTRAGRLAMLTNLRRPNDVRDGAPSRGELVPRWLRGDLTAEAFTTTFRPPNEQPNPFTVIAADLPAGVVFTTSSDSPDPQPLAPGAHALSNARLDAPWPKAVSLQHDLVTARDDAPDAAALVETLIVALADRTTPPDDALPDTGVGLEWERNLGSRFIHVPDRDYGTRCSTVLVSQSAVPGGSRRTTLVAEQTYDASGAPGGRQVERLTGWPPA